VLHNDPLSYDLARVLSHVGLVQRVVDVPPGRGEVGEIHHRHKIEVALKMAGVIAPRQDQQFWNGAQTFQGITKSLLCLR